MLTPLTVSSFGSRRRPGRFLRRKNSQPHLVGDHGVVPRQRCGMVMPDQIAARIADVRDYGAIVA